MCFASNEKADRTRSSLRLASGNPKKMNSSYGYHLNGRKYLISIGLEESKEITKGGTIEEGKKCDVYTFHSNILQGCSHTIIIFGNIIV